jgi:hypothetical protein
MEDDKRITGKEQPQDIERRGLASAVSEFVSSVPVGAGLTTGGLLAKEGFAKIKQTLAPAPQEPPKKD